METLYLEATSAYAAKLNQFLDGQSPQTIKFVKDALNAIFMGIKKDFDGYIEGKRPTIKDYGKYQTFSIMIQANNALKPKDRDGKARYGYYDPVEDYCSNLGKIYNRNFDGMRYQCVYNTKESLDDNVWSRSEIEELTSPAKYALVGCYCTGANGRYKNLSKEVAGNTYSVIVSVPQEEGESFKNSHMQKSGDTYSFANGNKNSSGYGYSVTYDLSDQEFTIRSSKDNDPDTLTILYGKSRNSFKAFKELVKTFDEHTTQADVEQLLQNFNVRIKHSWWFNPYTD